MNESTDELVILRRDMDRQRQERIDHLEKQIQEMKSMITDMSYQMTTIIDRQSQYDPTMMTLKTVMTGGIVLKWVLIIIVGTLGTVATANTAWEVIQKWSR